MLVNRRERKDWIRHHCSRKMFDSSDNQIETIRSLDREERESILDNLRTEYQAITDYTVHYSNVRLALSTFFISVAFYLMLVYVIDKQKEFLLYSGLFIQVFGYAVNLFVTRLMYGGLRQLVQIEYILSSVPYKQRQPPFTTLDGISRLMNYFSSWAGKYPARGSLIYALTEKLSVFYISLTAVYFLAWLNILCKISLPFGIDLSK